MARSTKDPVSLPRLAAWLQGDGRDFLCELLESPGRVDAGWLYAAYRGFGMFHYAIVLSEPPEPFHPPTILDPQPATWPVTLIDGAELSAAIAASAEDPKSVQHDPRAVWWIRRDTERIVVYIEIELMQAYQRGSR